MVLLVTLGLAAVVVALLGLLVALRRARARSPHDAKHRAPGPKPWPLLGSLHLMGRYEVPFEAFTALAKVYGDIYSITLGTTTCVVVNNFQLIKEVLITKGSHFGGRPDFIRFHKLFGGDRNNSLALCDWSDLQKTRRSIARMYCSPRFASVHYDNLDQVGCAEVVEFLSELSSLTAGSRELAVKPLIQAACFNMFTQYMCSTRFSYDDPASQSVIRTFDEIFWEINQGYAVDFLPWLLPAYRAHMRQISGWAHLVRQFILRHIIDEHRRTMDASTEPRDFTDALLIHLQDDPHLNWEHIIFELEDFLGGHSAIGNLIMLALAAVVRHPEVGARIQKEVDVATGGSRNVSLFDKPAMPYTEATILETLRTASSPIVPHVATQDTSIAGYAVDKGTMVFLNNYELNSSEKCWEAPFEFRPERFVVDGKVNKPEYFIPFSTGKRTCIGQRLVQGFAFIMLASILQNYDVSCSDPASIRTYPACVAVPADTFSLSFTPRHCVIVQSV
ncbi:cytochrome P450 307a1 [Periplaneta americana]|uniref:cytochrome P450 307a1 n=1 Tax=Periplaneta americana TaxID=6978 RepID=UPI0037E815EA